MVGWKAQAVNDSEAGQAWRSWPEGRAAAGISARARLETERSDSAASLDQVVEQRVGHRAPRDHSLSGSKTGLEGVDPADEGSVSGGQASRSVRILAYRRCEVIASCS